MQKIVHRTQVALIFAGLLLSASLVEGVAGAYAQPAPPHEHAGKGPRGGALQDIAGYLGELVARSGKVVLYLRDHETRAPVSTQGMRANVVFVYGGVRRGAVALHPAGERLEGAGRFPARTDAVVTLTSANGGSSQAKFDAGG